MSMRFSSSNLTWDSREPSSLFVYVLIPLAVKPNVHDMGSNLFLGKDLALKQNGECGGEKLRCQVSGEPAGSDGGRQGRGWGTHGV